MTVQKPNNLKPIIISQGVYRFNLFLALFAISSVLVYIFFSNYALSERYRFESLKRRVDQMVVGMNSEQTDVNDDQTVKSLLIYAQKSGMVEAKDAYSLFKDSGVALSNIP